VMGAICRASWDYLKNQTPLPPSDPLPKSDFLPSWHPGNHVSFPECCVNFQASKSYTLTPAVFRKAQRNISGSSCVTGS
jgi:hypothetical protein